MKDERILMGLPITVEIVSSEATEDDLSAVFEHFERVDALFSTYRYDSEISALNRGELSKSGISEEVREILERSEETKALTGGFFDIDTGKGIDPSGLVKGWSIQAAADILIGRGFADFYIEAGGDIATCGRNLEGMPWRVGIRNPFGIGYVKVLTISGKGVATSGTYVRGQHIYDPHQRAKALEDVVSLTVIGPDVYEADRFATAAFAMGKRGIEFIDSLEGFEGYQIDQAGIATATRGFAAYVS